ncbi:MAG: hypothetical protein QM777_02885 [Pseudorhodoferax sp.]
MTTDSPPRLRAGRPRRSAPCIHSPIHQADPVRHAAVLHTHMPDATALKRQLDPHNPGYAL